MDREELHRVLSHSLVTRVVPDETADQINYHVIFAQYTRRRAHFKTRPAEVTDMRTGSVNGFDPGGEAVAAVVALAPYAMALVDQVLDFLLGKTSESLGARIWAWITLRRHTRVPAELPVLTAELLEGVESLSRTLADEWELEPHKKDQLTLALVKLLLEQQKNEGEA
ncbi:hypothetical protein [Streptomyces diastatochromogenes]|uniref:Uncharacterized protein n=1 Tax=Streptomyces diastatochromogenes TaxID=42236 RepID=A0A233RVW8_STRDA|nr:hypothetical protein [Streptomyces diastatochromogenes]MCZ0991388.1 hypothetical protein [Streptomyces diastatochromogenes]OXY87556.1 hypothetical protein BEK98_43630 [Streptomyces diastatochromogenes]